MDLLSELYHALTTAAKTILVLGSSIVSLALVSMLVWYAGRFAGYPLGKIVAIDNVRRQERAGATRDMSDAEFDKWLKDEEKRIASGFTVISCVLAVLCEMIAQPVQLADIPAAVFRGVVEGMLVLAMLGWILAGVLAVWRLFAPEVSGAGLEEKQVLMS